MSSSGEIHLSVINVGARLNQVSKSHGDAVGAANRGSHHGVSQAQLGAIRDDTRGLCKWLRSQ